MNSGRRPNGRLLRAMMIRRASGLEVTREVLDLVIMKCY